MTVSPLDLNARGVRVRQGIDVMRRLLGGANEQTLLEVQLIAASFSNLMLLIEKDYGVPPGYFGSFGIKLPEINPFDGIELPDPISSDPIPPFVGPPQGPLNPPELTPGSLQVPEF